MHTHLCIVVPSVALHTLSVVIAVIEPSALIIG